MLGLLTFEIWPQLVRNSRNKCFKTVAVPGALTLHLQEKNLDMLVAPLTFVSFNQLLSVLITDYLIINGATKICQFQYGLLG